jgi:aspartate/methionine/tyrosine aminotransferase
MKIADRMHSIQRFHVMDLLGRARQLEAEGRDVVHMEIGEPDFVTPEPVIRAGIDALVTGRTHYTPAPGLPELRQSISRHYHERFGVDVPAQRIIVTPGASGALQLIFAVLFNPGDRVLMADPTYPCNRNFAHLYGAEPVPIAVDADTAYQLDARHVTELDGGTIEGILVASPSNPTGTLVSGESLDALLAVARKHNTHFIMDEIYQGLVYGSAPQTVLNRSNEAFVVNSFSKYFGMTGWRIGWLVVPEGYTPEFEKLAQNIFLAPSTLAQYAALDAFGDESLEILEQRRAEFQKRRDFLFPALQELGFRIPVVPEGAFYIYADSSDLTDDSYSFAMDLLEREAVAITPGLDFGSHRPAAHVRFAYTTSMVQLEKGVERLRRYLGTAC